jgi:adenosylcobinamide kinase / adenosylcobinamide-phosphate guanylyltransferase
MPSPRAAPRKRYIAIERRHRVIVLVGGGSRSGKSKYALEYARGKGRPLAFIATAEPRDEEMRARSEAHRRDRGDEFATIEEPLELELALAEAVSKYRSIVVDCLTLWLSNLMLEQRPRDVSRETASMLRIGAEADSTVVLVTNEVGCGIVPENDLSRRFRDSAGAMNQHAAQAAAEVWWMVFGCALRVK